METSKAAPIAFNWYYYFNWFFQQIARDSLYFLGYFPTTVIEFLLTIFSHGGNLNKLIFDKAPLFTAVWSEVFLRERHITPWNSSIYYPHASEKTEHFNWVLKECLQTADLEGKPCKWFAIDFLQDQWETWHEAKQLSATAPVSE